MHFFHVPAGQFSLICQLIRVAPSFVKKKGVTAVLPVVL